MAPTSLSADRLIEACDDMAVDAGITIRATLEPLAGQGAPVKPAVYAGGRYQLDRRWESVDGEQTAVDVVVIDNVPSQANRLEAALQGLQPRLGLPMMVLDLSGVGTLPPHLPNRLSSFRFPHRQADAYLRDSLLDSTPFLRTDVGRRVLGATAEDPGPLLEWFPQALVFGFWQSHLGKKRSQAKLARSWTSEIVGYRPATTETKLLGLKGDPLNLSVDEPAEYNPNDLFVGWSVIEGAKKVGGGRVKERLSELGHGQVPVNPADAAPAGISFGRIEQQSTVSFAGLRRVVAGAAEANATARALLVAIGVAAHVTAFGRSFSLRSGCELRPRSTDWTWLGGTDFELAPLSIDEAIDLVSALAARAESAGLPVGSRWPAEPLRLEPSPELAKVIHATWPVGG